METDWRRARAEGDPELLCSEESLEAFFPQQRDMLPGCFVAMRDRA